MTGAGGFMQGLIYGFSILRMNDSALTMGPHAVPEGASGLRLRGIAYAGNRLEITLTPSTLSVALEPLATEAQTTWRPTHRYARHTGAADATSTAPSPLSLFPTQPLQARSQLGQVVLDDGTHLRAVPLVLVDESGASHALAVGAPVTLPRQRVAITAAAA